MINLLPHDARENFMYGRRNTLLVRWLVALLIGIAGIALVVLAGLFYIDSTTKQMSQQVDQAQQELKAQKVEETQKRTEEMSSNFKLVTQVLSRQVLFSEVLKQVGAVMPDGTALANLNVGTLEGGIDLQVLAKDYVSATQAQVNLQDPSNKLFSQVDIINITCEEEVGEESIYPCSGRFRALFNKDNNPFLMLSKDAEEKKS